MFALSDRYGFLFTARLLQGVGSAFADTSGFSLIAETFTEPNERSSSLGIALAFISFGTLAAPPFGGIFYQLFGRRTPFLILSLIALCDLIVFLQLQRSRPDRFFDLTSVKINSFKTDKVRVTPIWQLLMDPYILVCAGALSVANICLAFIEPTIGIWMLKTMNAQSWQIGFVWFPAFLPHWIGVYLSVWLVQRRPHHHWAIAAAGLATESVMCVLVPFCSNYWLLIIPICGICFGNAMIDTAILPLVAHLTEIRHSSVYGSSYAIVDISYNIAYAFGPLVAGSMMHVIGFTYMNMLIFCVTMAYIPLLRRLRNVDLYKPLLDNDDVSINDISSAIDKISMNETQIDDVSYNGYLKM